MTRGRDTAGWQKALVCLLVGQLLVVAALVACPHLHQLFHHDADQRDHECAVTVMLSGGSDEVVPPLIVIAAPFFGGSGESIAPTVAGEIAPLFLGAHIFEHAPPAHA
jgi:hypothetical protein